MLHLVNWVEGKIIYLEPHETEVVIDLCMHLFQLLLSQHWQGIKFIISSSCHITLQLNSILIVENDY